MNIYLPFLTTDPFCSLLENKIELSNLFSDRMNGITRDGKNIDYVIVQLLCQKGILLSEFDVTSNEGLLQSYSNTQAGAKM